MWIISILSITGVVLNINKMSECFIIWSFTNAAWCMYDAYIGAYDQSALFFVYFVLAVWGLFKWKKEN